MGDLSNIDIGWRSALMFAVCLPILIAAGFLLSREVERRATLWLALFLVAAVANQIPQIIGFANFYAVWPGLTFAPFNTELYLGPLLYLHADRLMRGGPLGWRKWLLAPGIVQTAYYTSAFLFLGDYQAKWAYNDSFHEPVLVPLETIIAIGLIGWSLVAIIALMRRYHGFLQATQSAARDFEPVWIRRLLIALTPAVVIYTMLEIAVSFWGPISYVAAFPFEVAIMGCVLFLAFDALARLHERFPKMNAATDAVSRESEVASEKNWAEEGRLVRASVLDGAWHLEPRLSLTDVARRLATNETYVSKAINQGLDQTFTGFINGLRIDAAKRQLKETDDGVLDIALASGFNSKATFNRVFKDREGVTPSAYRKSQKA